MSEELPEGWVEFPLGELGSWFGGGTPSKSNAAYWTNGTIPWVSPKDMKRPLIDSAEDSITEMAVQGSSTKLVPKDCVLLVVRSGILAHTLPVAINTVPVTLNQDMKAIGPDTVGADFLAHGLRAFGPRILDECTKQGTTVASVNTEALHAFGFPLPPLNEQKRIVAKIDALTSRSREARQALDEVPALLDKLRQSILAAAFRGDLTKKWREQTRDVEPASALLERIRKERRRKWEEAELAKFKSKGKVPADDKWKAKYKEPEPVDTEGLPELPEGWCWASVEELIVDPLANGRSVPTREDGFPVLRLTALRDGKIDLSERKGGDWTEEQAAQFLVRDGDFLVSRGNGSLERVALGGHVRDADPVAFPDTLVRIRPSQSLTDNYFATVWASPGVRGQVEKKAKTTAGIHKVSQGDLGSIVIPVAPQGEQTAIVQVAGAGLDHSVNLRLLASALLESVPTLDASILTKAFRGELVPQDPNDEPASILLERIRKEREGGVANRTRTTAKRRKKDG